MDDIINQKFGKLTVIKATDKRSYSRSILYECKCECGNTCYVPKCNLKSGHTKSCGCTRQEKFAILKESQKLDLTGKKFGKLTAIKQVGKDKHNFYIWECKCECGNVINVISISLTSGNTKSCGCMLKVNLEVQRSKNSVENTNVAALKNLLKNNKSKVTKSGVKGVGWDKRKNKWRTYIMFQRKFYHLGYFADLKDAIKARKEAEEKIFGGFISWYDSMNKMDETKEL